MIAKEFPQQNFTFGKPANMTDEQCYSLKVWKGTDSEGFPCIISCWHVTEEDLERIKETKEVWLKIIGQGMPPVVVLTENLLR